MGTETLVGSEIQSLLMGYSVGPNGSHSRAERNESARATASKFYALQW